MDRVTASASISIRKKSRSSDVARLKPEQGSAPKDSLQSVQNSSFSPSHHSDVLKQRAMDELKIFLDRKGVPRSRADEFQIHIKQKGSQGGGSYSVHYTDKNGEIYMSKADLYVSLNRPPEKSPSAQVCFPTCISIHHRVDKK